MTKKLMLKILLDVTMTVIYILLMFPYGTGVFFHVAAGLAVGGLFILHFILNRDVFSAMLRSARNKRITPRSALLLALDVLLIVGMPVLIVTGVLISSISPIDLGAASFLVLSVHNISAYACLAAMLSHLAVHAKYLVSAFRSMYARRRDREVRKAFARFSSAVMAACMIYVIGFQLYKSGIAVPTPASSVSQSEITYHQESTYSGSSDNTVVVSGSGSSSASSDSSSGSVSSSSSSSGSSSSGSSSAVVSNSGSDDSSASSSTVTATTSTETDTGKTLEEYLGTLFCTGCGRHCPLSNPQCGRSAQQIAQATADYNAKYSA
jgi:uncharacterized membrane protein YgcG